jgi:hypothetical protein
MLAAVYARQATDQTGGADEQQSVARLVDHDRADASTTAGPRYDSALRSNW